jgi:hypothetical protein
MLGRHGGAGVTAGRRGNAALGHHQLPLRKGTMGYQKLYVPLAEAATDPDRQLVLHYAECGFSTF